MTVEDLIYLLETRANADCKVSLRNADNTRDEIEDSDIDIYDDEIIIG